MATPIPLDAVDASWHGPIRGDTVGTARLLIVPVVGLVATAGNDVPAAVGACVYLAAEVVAVAAAVAWLKCTQTRTLIGDGGRSCHSPI